MANENANQDIEFDDFEDLDFEVLDFKQMEDTISKAIEENFSDLELLERDRETISNPDSFGKVVSDEIWKQFGNQIGLDMTNETLIQKYDREHPEEYKDIAASVMQDPKYKNANKMMKEQQQAGNLMDEYTGENFKYNDKPNLDHVRSRLEIYKNQRRKQAGLSVATLANIKENFKVTNESLNKSKGAKNMKEFVANREIREKSLIEQNKKANQKVDESNKSDLEKKLQKEKNNKRLKDKLAADDARMLEADKEAGKAIGKEILIKGSKEVGKKAGKDALKAMAVSALFSLLKEVMKGLIRFFKEKSKSFKGFLSEMKESIRLFFTKIQSVVKTGSSSFIGTIVSEIFGPIVSTFKRLASLIKQGISSVIDAINYLRDKNNKDKLFSVKAAQVGKLITVGLVGGNAIFLGEVFEKILLTVPGMQIGIPLIGTYANMIGLFLSSLVSGLVGAIVLNFIDKFIARKLKEESDGEIIDKKNEIIYLQEVQMYVAENRVVETKENAMNNISRNHKLLEERRIQLRNKLFNKENINYSDDIDNNKK